MASFTPGGTNVNHSFDFLYHEDACPSKFIVLAPLLHWKFQLKREGGRARQANRYEGRSMWLTREQELGSRFKALICSIGIIRGFAQSRLSWPPDASSHSGGGHAPEVHCWYATTF